MPATVRVKLEWLHVYGRHEYTQDTSFLVVSRFTSSGCRFYGLLVPWQDYLWVVAEWRLVK